MKKIASSLFATLLSAVSIAQMPAVEKAVDGFSAMCSRLLQEKVYVMTDKPYYSAGERIYLRGWVVDAVSHTGATPSNFLYVELLDSEDALVSRIKIRRDSLGFANAIDLPADIVSGSYSLVAYTLWQTNFDPDLFFRRQIEIGNTIDDSVMCDVDYRLGSDGIAVATVRLYGPANDYAGVKVSCEERRAGKRGRKYSVRTDDGGRILIEYRPDAVDAIEIAMDVPDRHFRRTVPLPDLGGAVDLQFLPEGGDLVAGASQRVAFKAVGPDGYSVELNGTVYDGDDRPVADFATSHRGMGFFEMTPQAGAEYYAVTEYDGRRLRYDLPSPAGSGCALRAERDGSGWRCSLLASPDFDPSRSYALVHTRGALALGFGDLSRDFRIDDADLLDGVSQIVVMDRITGRVYSERSIFKHPERQPQITLVTDKPAYGRRDDVHLDICVADSDGRGVAGDFAVTVTDSRTVRRAAGAENIVSYLLLRSDLGGRIEQPSEYLDTARDKTDLLMMTHGWRRFDVRRTICDSLPECEYGFETTQAICGRVFNYWNRDPRQAQLLLYNERTGRFEHFEMGGERNGRFRIENLDFPDSTRFSVTALSRSGSDKTLSVRLFPDPLPINSANIRHRIGRQSGAADIPDEYLDAGKRSYYEEGGIRVIDIEEVVVRAKPLKSSVFAGVTPLHEASGERLKHYYNAVEMAAALPGVYSNGVDIKVRLKNDMTLNEYIDAEAPSAYSYVTPVIYADDMAVDVEFLASVYNDDVISVSYIPPSRAGMYGPDAAMTGIVYYTLKPLARRKAISNPSTDFIMPLGYKTSVEFYEPKYDVRPDLRTTVAWKPSVRTDAGGRAAVELRTGDRTSGYDIVLEGLTDDGRACFAVGSIQCR